MINRLKQNLINIPGWRTNRKIIVFESDDWGSIRMPSKNVYNELQKKNIRVDKSKYDSLDILENEEDLNNLFSLLSNYRDSNNHHPIFTFNTVMGNPDFNKIREDNFEQFSFELFFDSYSKYYGKDFRSIWQEAIKNGIIQPQFHAREHLNTNLWMKDLMAEQKETRIAFDYQFFGLKTPTSSPHQKHYLSAYRAENFKELDNLKKITQNGLSLFESLFGFKSSTIIACNYVWPTELEPFFLDMGVKSIQGQRGHIVPDLYKNGKVKIKRHYTGQQNLQGQSYMVRNVKFEPFENPNIDWIKKTLKDIENAFFWKKPAIISTHRINYVGGIDVNHRDHNLKLLNQLLRQIIKKWPDAEFLSSDMLGELINDSNKKYVH